MTVTKKTLIDTYSRKESDELLLLHNSGDLTSEAYEALECILNERGIVPPERIVPPEKDKAEKLIIGWKEIWLRFFGAFGFFVLMSHFFYPYPNPWTAGSPMGLVGQTVGDLVVFIFFLCIVSLPILIYRIITRRPIKSSMPQLLNRALIWTLIMQSFMIFGGWYATNK